ncbi:hypothetical protein [Tumebacillus permanentifrigoris]|uniref:DUF1002 domain-containing protein n=1 Tax=Tumebacillus permanentifrigoris TaxID=378543 RepID=A0A316D5G1_9BACL|nr:hypothetical protein [Tumebacillus permanentifrigoris]PWK09007.1 hypothetical protein C7459_11473 [Tumebacillus permanentifrigoris]
MFNFKKILATTLVMTSLFSFAMASGAFAATTSTNQSTITQQQPLVQAPPSQQPQMAEPDGVKGYIVKKAVQLLATCFRKGAPYIGDVLEYLDAKTAKTAIQYSGKIASKLDEIAGIPDLATNVVKEKMYNFLLKDLKLSGGTALSIADGIKRALDILVF